MQPTDTRIIDGRVMAFRDVGEGPVVLFGHSYLWDSGLWSAQVEALSPQYRCIVPDLWAHGLSETLTGTSVTMKDLARDHLGLLDALGIERAAVAGLSAGGMWAAEMALMAPARVLALVLLNTFVGPEPESRKLRYLEMLNTVADLQEVPVAMLDALTTLFFSPESVANAHPAIAEFRESLIEWPREKLNGLVTLGRSIFSRQDALPRLPDLACPVLILAGQHDVSRPPEESEVMERQLRDVRLKILNCGHVSAVEQPAAVSEAIRAFLGEVDGF